MIHHHNLPTVKAASSCVIEHTLVICLVACGTAFCLRKDQVQIDFPYNLNAWNGLLVPELRFAHVLFCEVHVLCGVGRSSAIGDLVALCSLVRMAGFVWASGSGIPWVVVVGSIRSQVGFNYVYVISTIPSRKQCIYHVTYHCYYLQAYL